MALGGGTWLTQNKVLPGAYINFVSAAKATASLSDRGVVAMPLMLDWGKKGEMFTVTAEEFQKDSVKIFGYAYADEAMKGLRDLFMYAKTVHFYRLNGGTKAQNTYAQAKYFGTSGNKIKITVRDSVYQTGKYDVITLFDGVEVDLQTVAASSGLVENDFVVFKTFSMAAVTGAALTGGTSESAVATSVYQDFLDKAESYSFNILACMSDVSEVQRLFINYTKRLRDDLGRKFQLVVYNANPNTCDYEGVINVATETAGTNDYGNEAVYWVAGAEAGCAVNKSLANKVYDGEFTFDTNKTQTQLEDALNAGKFVFHKVGDEVRVLDDINSLTTTTAEKGEDFKSNQTIRVLDQIGNDIANLFNTKYSGQYPNDAAGRMSLWADIVKHHQELERIRAIEDFNPDELKVEKGEAKNAVLVTDCVTPVNCMTKLYMTVIVQ